MKNMYIKILKSKYFLAPVLIATFIFSIIGIFYASINDKVIFPNLDNYTYNCYADKANGGNSIILEHYVSDSIIKTKFLLNDAFYSPYIGLIITPKEKINISAQKYNQITIKTLGKDLDRVSLGIYTTPLLVDKNGKQDENLFHSFLNIASHMQTYHIPFNQLQHPEWWKDFHQLPESKTDKPQIKNILHINIGSAFSPGIEKEKTLEIYYLAFSRNNTRLFITLLLAYVILLLLYFAILYVLKTRKNNTPEITVSYQALDITSDTAGEEKCIIYINSNYNDSNLSLEKISTQTAVTPRRITNIIHSKFNCNFKTYLNKIRINESKRLLTQTELNIGEIAFKVGFNSQSHFNRVFKSEIKVSPSEYREQYQL